MVDASAALSAVLNDGTARRALASEQLHAPHLIDSEVANGLRHRVATQQLGAEAGWTAWTPFDVSGGRGTRCFTPGSSLGVSLLDRVWELRDNVSAHDASYVALAELWTAICSQPMRD